MDKNLYRERVNQYFDVDAIVRDLDTLMIINTNMETVGLPHDHPDYQQWEAEAIEMIETCDEIEAFMESVE
jgi:hypothetical protein